MTTPATPPATTSTADTTPSAEEGTSRGGARRRRAAPAEASPIAAAPPVLSPMQDSGEPTPTVTAPPPPASPSPDSTPPLVPTIDASPPGRETVNAETINAETIDAETIAGLTRWAESQPMPEGAERAIPVTRWHGFLGVGGGYGIPFGSDVLGLQSVGVAAEDPGFAGFQARIDGGVMVGPWSFGLSLPVFHTPGSDAGLGAATLLGVEAQVRFTLRLGRVMGLGLQLSGGPSVVRTEAAIDADSVAQRLDAYLIPSGEAALVVSERLGGHWRLEQQLGVRAYRTEFLDGVQPILSLQIGVRHVL